MNTDQVSPGDRIPYWSDWIDRLFNGPQSDLYGDLDLDGRMNASRAGNVILTRLEANRHRVMRSRSLARERCRLSEDSRAVPRLCGRAAWPAVEHLIVHLSLLELAGRGPAATQREALRERIKQQVARRLADPQLCVHEIALALNCSRRHLYDAFSDEPEGFAGFILAAAASVSPRARRRRRVATQRHRHRDVQRLQQPCTFQPRVQGTRARHGMSPSEYRAWARTPLLA